MEQKEIRSMLEQVARGTMDVDSALLKLKRTSALPRSMPIGDCGRELRR